MEERSFEERLGELKERYVGLNDFDFITILKLEDEYNDLLKFEPGYTKGRNEILDMRRRMISNLRLKA